MRKNYRITWTRWNKKQNERRYHEDPAVQAADFDAAYEIALQRKRGFAAADPLSDYEIAEIRLDDAQRGQKCEFGWFTFPEWEKLVKDKEGV